MLISRDYSGLVVNFNQGRLPVRSGFSHKRNSQLGPAGSACPHAQISELATDQ